MYTLCPSCKTLFGINVRQLAAAQGRVRCSVCRVAFSALDNLSEQPDDLLLPGRMPKYLATSGVLSGTSAASAAPMEAVAFIPVQSAAAAPEEIIAIHDRSSASDVRIERAGAVTADEFDLINAPPIVGGSCASLRSPHLDVLPGAGERLEPDSAVSLVGPKRISLSATLIWSVTNLALMAVLVVQFAYFNRDDLARHAQWRPALEEMCRHAGCTLLLRSDITKITLVNRELRSHPSVANALLVTATLVNNAPFPQSYPMLQLSLSDFSGRTVAMRRFQPTEYMSKIVQISGGMRPGQPIEVSLELADPGKAAVGFEFTFI